MTSRSLANAFKNPGLAILLMAIMATGCTKNSHTPGVPQQPEQDTTGPTPVGTPIGDPEFVTIGSTGGTFTTSDNRLILDFPAGALTAETTISIQPVTNNCPAGSGTAYLITPHDISFKQKVRLTMRYDDSDIVNSIPAAMAIAFQDQQGIWQSPGSMTRDTVNKTVTVLTDHFSGWSLFQNVRMFPASSVLEPGGSLKLFVEKYRDPDDIFAPIPGPLSKKDALVKEWKLGGQGQLTPENHIATYTAPASIPSNNPVAVTAVLNTTGPDKFMFVSNIYIGREGVTFRIDNGPWMHGGTTGAIFSGYNNIVSAGNENTPQPDGVTFTWMGESHFNEFVPWKKGFPSFTYGEQPTVNYTQLLVPSGNPSPGGIYFDKAARSATTPWVIGSFYLTPAQKTVYVPNNKPQYSAHRIEGFFKVKWQL